MQIVKHSLCSVDSCICSLIRLLPLRLPPLLLLLHLLHLILIQTFRTIIDVYLVLIKYLLGLLS